MKIYGRLNFAKYAGWKRPKFTRLLAHTDCTEVAEAFYMLRAWRFDRREVRR